MSPRTNIVVAVGLVVFGAGGAAGLASLRSGIKTVDAADPVDLQTVAVDNRDLVIEHEVVGRLAPAASLDVASPAEGTLLTVADLGSVVSAGAILAVVDDRPVVVLDGDTPAWRELSVGSEGVDVEQLEAALVGAGFDADANVTVDEEYTSATASMVEEWQESLGADPTGIVGRGAVVFLESPMRVESTTVDVGALVAVGDVLVGLASLDRVATADVAVADTLDLAIGDAVSVRLPDRSTLQADVGSITAGTDTSTRSVTVDIEESESVIGLGSSDVDLSWSETVALDVPTLPSGVFRRLENGTYVIDIVGDGGIEVLVVELVRHVGSRVEVSGVPVDAQVLSP
jgi:multidrug efflux system membrane fusion protein